MTNQSTKTALPWPGNDVIAPNLILRTSLFSASDINSEPEVLDNEIFHWFNGCNITFSGKRLYQNDLDKWLGILRLIALDKDHAFTLKSKNSFLKMLGLSSSGQNIKGFDISMEKLTTCEIIIRNKEQAVVYTGPLIDKCNLYNDDKRCTYYISLEMIALFSPGNWSCVDWAVRKELRRHPLAAWLHSYYSTHKNSLIPIGVEKIQKLCGSKNLSSKSFKQKLEKAALHVKNSCNENDKEFEWEIKGKNFHVIHHTLGKKQTNVN